MQKNVLNLIGIFTKMGDNGDIGNSINVHRGAIVPRNHHKKCMQPKQSNSGFIRINERMLKNVLNLIRIFTKTGDNGDIGDSIDGHRVSIVPRNHHNNNMQPNPNNPGGFIPLHGGYRNLISYQKSEIVYDGTVYFTKRFFQKYDRTIDQMVQAARSGKQNIAEASMASATSKETEIKLTNVARASLEELLIDYEDFLRTHKLKKWEKDNRLSLRFSELNKTLNGNYQTFVRAIENPDPEICANTMICLIRVTTYLLAQLIKTLEKEFINEGGLRERMTKARIEQRNKK